MVAGRSFTITGGHAVLAARAAHTLPLAKSEETTVRHAEDALPRLPAVRYGHVTMAAKLYRPTIGAAVWYHLHACAHPIPQLRQVQPKGQGKVQTDIPLKRILN